MSSTCVRVECDKPLHKGKFYCSNSCAAAERSAKRKSKSGRKVAPSLVRETIPDEVVTLLTDRVGEDAYEVLDEMAVTMLESAIPAPPLAGKTGGDFYYSHWIAGEDRRPSDALTFKTIDEMLKSGLVQFVLEMKLAALMSIYRSPGSWKVVSPDRELADVVTANLREILPVAAMDFLRSSMQYGVSFSEKTYEFKTPYELGLSKGRGSSKQYAVARVPNSVNPNSVDHIRRTPSGDFDGFVQMPINNFENSEIVVPRDQALVIPYKMQFRNLWGESYLKPMYPFWFWFEISLRSWARYVERMGTPVAICYAPSRAQVKKPGTSTLVNAMTWGLAVAGQIAKSNATVLPSDLDPQTGQPLWKLEYLVAQDRGSTFKEVIEALMRLTVQAGMSADMTFTQPSGGTGSFNIWEGHNSATQLHNELILTDTIAAINKWWMTDFSRYNRGENGPPIWLETEGLDPAEREHLFKLANIAGNSQAFQDALIMIDWRELYELNNVPTLSEEDFTRIKEELEKEALRKQREFQKPKEQQGPVTRESESSKAASDEEKKKAEKLEQIAFMIVDGQYEAMILSDHEMDLLLKTRKAGVDIAISTLEDTTQLAKIDVESGNPYRGVGGRFAPKDEGGDKEEEKEGKGRPEGWPEFASDEEAQKFFLDALRNLGIGVPDGFNMEIQDMPPGVVGLYNAETNTIIMSAQQWEDMKNGDLMGVSTFLHEAAHANQRSDKSDEDDPTGRANADMGNDEFFRGMAMIEGQNDLVALMAMTELYGRPITNEEITADYNAKMTERYASNPAEAPPPVIRSGYDKEAGAWAALALANEEKTGQPAKEFIIETHGEGMDLGGMQYKILEDLFPYAMDAWKEEGLNWAKDWPFPPAERVEEWLDNEYGIDANTALEEILDG